MTRSQSDVYSIREIHQKVVSPRAIILGPGRSSGGKRVTREMISRSWRCGSERGEAGHSYTLQKVFKDKVTDRERGKLRKLRNPYRIYPTAPSLRTKQPSWNIAIHPHGNLSGQPYSIKRKKFKKRKKKEEERKKESNGQTKEKQCSLTDSPPHSRPHTHTQ